MSIEQEQWMLSNSPYCYRSFCLFWWDVVSDHWSNGSYTRGLRRVFRVRKLPLYLWENLKKASVLSIISTPKRLLNQHFCFKKATNLPVFIGSWHELDIKFPVLSDELSIVLQLILAPVGTVVGASRERSCSSSKSNSRSSVAVLFPLNRKSATWSTGGRAKFTRRSSCSLNILSSVKCL